MFRFCFGYGFGNVSVTFSVMFRLRLWLCCGYDFGSVSVTFTIMLRFWLRSGCGYNSVNFSRKLHESNRRRHERLGNAPGAERTRNRTNRPGELANQKFGPKTRRAFESGSKTVRVGSETLRIESETCRESVRKTARESGPAGRRGFGPTSSRARFETVAAISMAIAVTVRNELRSAEWTSRSLRDGDGTASRSRFRERFGTRSRMESETGTVPVCRGPKCPTFATFFRSRR